MINVFPADVDFEVLRMDEVEESSLITCQCRSEAPVRDMQVVQQSKEHCLRLKWQITVYKQKQTGRKLKWNCTFT